MKIREIFRRWLGVEADILQAVKKEREKADSEKRRITNEKDEQLKEVKKALAEKEAILRLLTKEKAESEQKHTEEIEALRKKMADAANEEAKKFAEIQGRIEKYKKVENAVAELKKGPGRPREDRVPFNLKIDRALKETIALLEGAGIIKRGAVTSHLNDELWRWLSPMRELIDFEEEDRNNTVPINSNIM